MKIMKWAGPAAAMLAMVLATGAPAEAQTKNPCAGDIAKYCKDVTPGGGRLVQCLKQHESELSAECKAGQEKAREKAKEAHEACADDVQKLCKDVVPGGGRIVRCLKDNSKSLSPECRDKLAPPEKRPKHG
ncbi:MAG: cysteine rich repeat-containing protein [Hyphomicrobiales bacterium]